MKQLILLLLLPVLLYAAEPSREDLELNIIVLRRQYLESELRHRQRDIRELQEAIQLLDQEIQKRTPKKDEKSKK